MENKLRNAREFALVIVLGLVAVAIVVVGWAALEAYGNGQAAPYVGQSGYSDDCNVVDVTLYGGLVYYPGEGLESSSTGGDQTAAEDVRQQVEAADADPGIKAILLQIDSPGGDPVAGEDVAAALRHASKPTVALVADEGDSAAYWAATGAQTIFASDNSSLGDIGVTESYLDQTKEDEEDGLTFISLAAGQYKDMGNPEAPLTPAERALFERDLNLTMQSFIDSVATNRNLSVASVTAIADGSSMEGQMALQDGLIDKIGDIYDVEDYLQGKIGEGVVLCE